MRRKEREMSEPDLLFSFALAAILVIIVPGPATLLVGSQAHRSHAHAAWATLGIVSGDLVLITLAGSGFAFLMTRFPWLGQTIRGIGALYLAYLGWNLLRRAATRRGAADISERNSFLQGLLITLSNPKVILFFSSFLPLYIRTDTQTPVADFYFLGAVFEVINLGYFFALVLLVRQLAKWRTPDTASRHSLARISGTGLLLCAAFMLLRVLY
jgi:leucine efflux protein